MAISPKNQLLAAMPVKDYLRLVPHLELVSLETEQVLYQPSGPIDQIYFPETAVVTKLVILEDGRSSEVGMVGKEGMTGLYIFLETDESPFWTIVQLAGLAQRMTAKQFLEDLGRSSGECQYLLRRYTAGFLTQVSQLAACNQLHSVQKRCCRLLLSTSDRLGSDEIALTQELLASLIGVRRASVGDVMGELKMKKLIA